MSNIPSIAMIPSAYKSGKVYSVLPTDGSADLNFSRASEATRVNQNGLIETVGSNVPRLNYPLIDGVVSGCPSLLLENSATNILSYSEDFSQSYWGTSRIETPYIADTISPDGTLNAYTLEMSSGQNTGGGVLKTGISISGDNSFSVFAKKKTANYLALGDTGLTSNAVYFDLENGVVGTTYNATGEIQDFGNGWYRCTMKYTLTSSGAKFIYLSNIDGVTSNAVQGGDSIYIYGAMLEAGSYPTSYIPTNGSQVTRSAETCNNAGDVNTFNDSEGVLFAEISALADDGTARVITINDGGSSDYIGLRYHTVSNTIRFLVKSGGTTNFDYFITLPSTEEYNKIAIKYENTNVYLWANGFEYFQFSPITTPIGLSTLNFDDSVGGNDFYGNTKQLQYFDTALTDTDLEEMTGFKSFVQMANQFNYTVI